MPKNLKITPAQRAQVLRLYAAGSSPEEITRSLRDLALNSKQVQNLCQRSGLVRKKAEGEREAKKSAVEVLQAVQSQGLDQLETMLRDVMEGARIDAEQLKDGWAWVQDAAGASSLQRAKLLLLSRILKLHGLDQPQQSKIPTNLLAVLYAKPVEHQAEAIDLAPESEATSSAESCDDMNLDFEEP